MNKKRITFLIFLQTVFSVMFGGSMAMEEWSAIFIFLICLTTTGTLLLMEVKGER